MTGDQQTKPFRRLAVWGVLLAVLLATGNAIAAEDSATDPVQAYSDPLSPSLLFANEALILRSNHFGGATGNSSSPDYGQGWLPANADAGPVEGEKVVSRLLERKLKAYFHSTRTSQWLKQKLLPEQDGTNFIKGVDYDLKLRTDEFAIGVVYEF